MQQKQPIQVPLGISIGDIYYVLFRRKWMILGFALLGIIAAVVFQLFQKPVYSSEAKLFIRYLQESKSVSPFGSDARIKSLNDQGDSIMNSELEILTSLDVAKDVAAKIGPEKIIGKSSREADEFSAAALIRKNMLVEAPRRTSVIRIQYKHTDPRIVQAVLMQIIDSYFEKHLEIHRKAGVFDEVLQTETLLLKGEIGKTEERLSKIKHDAGIISLEDAKKTCASQLSRVGEELFNAEAQLVERQAIVKELTNHLPDSQKTNQAPEEPKIPGEVINEYKDILARLDTFTKQKQDLESRFNSDSALVKEAVGQIDRNVKLKEKLEKEHPSLARVEASPAKNTDIAPDLYLESIRLTALNAKIERLKAQQTKLREEAGKLEEVEAEIIPLQRQLEVDGAQYRYYLTSKDASRVSDSLGAGKVSNISKIQTPSPAFIDGVSNFKIAIGISIGGIVFGLALAFFTEFFLDRTVKRPIELEKRMHIPLLISIPDQGRNGIARKLKKEKKKLLAAKASEVGAPSSNGNGNPPSPAEVEIPPWDDKHSLRPFYEGLRDRLVTYFEVRNLTHNPKLIGLAGCAKGAGVSTVAAGLAASLSETGDGNVLLVDMNVEHGAAQHFHHGKPSFDLAELLENGKKNEAQVQDNLYVVRERGNGGKLPRILPKRFSSLVPKLKASDYDYIIFDMPPVSQISVTPRLAGFMDMVMLVVESEKTDREAVQRAYSMLVESKANVTAVLNKTHSYVPKRLHQDMPGDAV